MPINRPNITLKNTIDGKHFIKHQALLKCNHCSSKGKCSKKNFKLNLSRSITTLSLVSRERSHSSFQLDSPVRCSSSSGFQRSSANWFCQFCPCQELCKAAKKEEVFQIKEQRNTSLLYLYLKSIQTETEDEGIATIADFIFLEFQNVMNQSLSPLIN
jgi:hypothetical protein